ncbi:iron compound ABC transporter, iron compound-binding protein [Lachnospiraceae bacterium KM106-2]|nr:iron compound ABC transporter, iron compound-binding protein [Lachnospiraceae bacterium KM106-2]
MLLVSCGKKVEKEDVKKQKVTAVVGLGSYAKLWRLAGGTVLGASSDAFSEERNDIKDYGENIGGIQSLNVEKIIQLDPDVVLLTSNIKSQVALKTNLEKAGISVEYLEVETFEDYCKALKKCTKLTGKTENYKKYGMDVKDKITSIINSVPKQKAPRILLMRAFSTGIKTKRSDNMVGAMLKDLGCINIADQEQTSLENLSVEQIRKEDPDYIFITTMGDSTAAKKMIAKELENNPVWNELSAVKNKHYIILKKELFQYKPNEKWSESYQVLAEILYGREED